MGTRLVVPPSPAAAALSRQRVLSAALELIDAEGVQALTMRRLAVALNRDPMTIYRYATSRADVLDGVADMVLAQVAVPEGSGDWEEDLRGIARGFRQVALAHPHVVPLLVARSLGTPFASRPREVLKPLESLFALLAGAGFAEGELARIYRAYRGFVYGHVLTELERIVTDAQEIGDLVRTGLHRLPVPEFPRLRALAGDLAGVDGAAELEEGLDLLLAGFRARLSAHSSATPTARPA